MLAGLKVWYEANLPGIFAGIDLKPPLHSGFACSQKALSPIRTPSRAMVFAAGLGTRMRPISDHTPKPLVEVGGRTLIDHALDRLARAGVATAIVNVHYLADQIENHLAARQHPKIVISDERALLLDQGGGIKKALPLLGDDAVLPLQHRCFLDRRPVLQSPASGCRLGPRTHGRASSRRECCDERRRRRAGRFHDGCRRTPERSASERGVAPFVYSGVGIIKPQLFMHETRDVFRLAPFFFAAGEAGRLYGVRLDGIWLHVGTPEAIAEANRVMARSHSMSEARPIRPRVFNIPAGVAFLPTFAASLLDRRDCSRLSGQRAAGACRGDDLCADAARRAGRSPWNSLGFFPVLRPCCRALSRSEIWKVSKSDLLLHEAGPDDVVIADLPEAASEIDRRMTLTRLVLAWAHQIRQAIVSIDANGEAATDPDEALLVTTAPGQAWHLAGDLGGLIDEMIIEGIDWTALEKIVPDAFDQYWRITLEFLKIAVAQWPAHLAERNLIDGTERRARLIEAEVARLAVARANGPVIAIGSTGTNRATARLLAAIARSPDGAVVLPGLDRELDEAAWHLIAGEKFDGHDSGAGHPQAALRRLLRVLQIARDDIVDLASPSQPIAARMQFLHEALRPADSTDHWHDYVAKLDMAGLGHALDGVTLIEADDERDEALALAVSLREVLERPGATAALVTPDRQLARRVRAELARWDIEVDDSGGEPLGTTAHGTLARLVLDCAAGVATPVANAVAARPSADASLAAARRCRTSVAALRNRRPARHPA